jgi:DNA-directed RNA polymerase subunit omega
MARVTVEDCLEKVDNRFMLVMLASKRVKQLYKGAKPLIDPKNNRYVVTSLREIAAGKLTAEVGSKRSA